MRRMSRWLAGTMLLVSSAASAQVASQEVKAAAGKVPDEKTAIQVAVRVWTPIYGVKNIASEKPYRASFKDGIWTVTGSLPEGAIGGTAHAEISAKDATVLRYWHEQ